MMMMINEQSSPTALDDLSNLEVTAFYNDDNEDLWSMIDDKIWSYSWLKRSPGFKPRPQLAANSSSWHICLSSSSASSQVAVDHADHKNADANADDHSDHANHADPLTINQLMIVWPPNLI